MFKVILSIFTFTLYLSSPEVTALEIVANVIKTQGLVEIQDNNGKRSSKVAVGATLSRNQILNTLTNGKVAIRTITGDTIVLNANSTIKARPETNTIEQMGGKVLYIFTPNKTIERNVRLHTATMGIRGTTFLVDFNKNQYDVVSLIEGTLEIESLNKGFNIFQQKVAVDFDSYKRQIEAGVAAAQEEFDQYADKQEEEFVAFKKTFILEQQQNLTLSADKAIVSRGINTEAEQSISELKKFIAE